MGGLGIHFDLGVRFFKVVVSKCKMRNQLMNKQKCQIQLCRGAHSYLQANISNLREFHFTI